MFGLVLLATAAAMHLYVFARGLSAPLLRRLPRRWVLGVAALLFGVLVLGRTYGRGDGPLAAAAERAGMTWLGALFLLFVCLLAADLATGFGFLLRRPAAALRGAALVGGLALGVVACVQGLRAPVVSEHEVWLSELPPELDGTTLVALSDLHLGAHLGSDWLAARLEQVRALEPDLVLLLGDIFEGHDGLDPAWAPLLGSLAPRLGSWAVLGNHDLHGGGEPSAALLEKAGVGVLRNRAVEVRPGLVLAGVDDLTAHRRRGHPGDPVALALGGRPPGATILLSHSPWEAEAAARGGADLMLSGHTHAGQIWPFGHLVALRYPLLEGRYDVAGMAVLVSRGAGTWGPRMRLFRPGELLRVTLRRDGPGGAPPLVERGS